MSRRLAALAEWVPIGARLADIGTDHALLPVFLAGAGRISFAVAGDVNAGPADAARRQVEEAGLGPVVSVRLGDGLSVLSPGEVDTVCIAGMGGSLIARILEQGAGRLAGVRTLVLSPHVAEDAVRTWLRDHRYVLDRELLLEEDGVIYTLLRAVRAENDADAHRLDGLLYDSRALAPCVPEVPIPLLLEMGPLLIREGGTAFRRKWKAEIAKREQIIGQMKRSSAPGAAEKFARWEADVARIREVLSCLPEEKPSFN